MQLRKFIRDPVLILLESSKKASPMAWPCINRAGYAPPSGKHDIPRMGLTACVQIEASASADDYG